MDAGPQFWKTPRVEKSITADCITGREQLGFCEWSFVFTVQQMGTAVRAPAPGPPHTPTGGTAPIVPLSSVKDSRNLWLGFMYYILNIYRRPSCAKP